ncbi:hypothetical protein GJ744_010777 [Endocarpon pusillum]|uniref:Major facilitator superfamily (MFS) profile domain-containing protein n=1 Tax=Endocarpon pusillum TaxID=364733 RepID=A0A8H7E1L6_9EURO|nr:hypothetical protein GJ744_010777 [Endocarpon pusillum]
MAFLWTGSQIPVFILGAIPPYIYSDIGGLDRYVWFALAYLLALAAVCPFVGSISDLMGRRYVALTGGVLLVVAMIVCSTAQVMNTFIAGMAIAGIGAGICELTALAGTAELSPTRSRGKYVAVLVLTILPFVPSVLWAQLIAAEAGWRYCGALCGAWAAVGLFATLFFYFPPPPVHPRVSTRKQILAEIDWIGGLLSIVGLILFMAGLVWGGYQYAWSSAHVLVPLLLGAGLLGVFCIWEAYGAKYPMFPARLKREPRILALVLIITFISGANFFSALMFWPTQASNVYGHDPIGVGIRCLPLGIGVVVGACVVLWLLSAYGHNKELMITSSVLMTAGCGSLAAATPDNLDKIYGLLVLAGLGVGGIVVPATIISTIICPDDLIATITALTLSVRVIGGAIGYAVYFSIFTSKFVSNAQSYIGGVMATQLNITDLTAITNAIELTAISLIEGIREIPGIAGNETAYQMVIDAGRLAYSKSYSYVYLVSIAFGVVSTVAACFLGDIDKYMDDHVAVKM